MRLRSPRTAATLLLQIQEYLGFNEVGVEVAPASEQLPVQLFGFLAATLVDMVVERL